MTLTSRHLAEVCMQGCHDAGLTCRYLRNDEIDESKWYCQKLQPEIKSRIDRDVNAVLESIRRPEKIKMPCGDNCAGYPLLKYIPQGFDAD
jgi:hypothetical protein